MNISRTCRRLIRRMLHGTTFMVLIHRHNLSIDIVIHFTTGPAPPTWCVHPQCSPEDTRLKEVGASQSTPDSPT